MTGRCASIHRGASERSQQRQQRPSLLSLSLQPFYRPQSTSELVPPFRPPTLQACISPNETWTWSWWTVSTKTKNHVKTLPITKHKNVGSALQEAGNHAYHPPNMPLSHVRYPDNRAMSISLTISATVPPSPGIRP